MSGPQAIEGEVYLAPPAVASGKGVPALNTRCELIVVAGGPSGALPVIGALADADVVIPAAASRVVSAVPITLNSMTFRNVSGAVRFFMIFDAAALPIDGTTPSRFIMRVEAGDTGSYAAPNTSFTIGLVWASSSTDSTLTLAGADFQADTYTYPP